MSRGLGKVQLRVLECLEYWPMTFRDLAQEIFDNDYPTRAEYESVARACRTLAKRGRVTLDVDWDTVHGKDRYRIPTLTRITTVSLPE